jgi:hypothetical protein
MTGSTGFLALSPERRGRAFEQAATERGLDPVIIEKDFWVCWLLGLLFSRPELGPQMVFKGGTSLSKIFGVIERFSEDIDLSVDLEFVGFDPQAFDLLTSRTKRDAAVAEMQRLCGQKTDETIMPVMEAAIRELLGETANGANWLRHELEDASGSPILYFRYPTTRPNPLGYVRQEVKLEMGSLTDQRPIGRYPVRPWIAENFPALFVEWRCDVTALELGRTFWEKATILHSEHFRPSDQPTPSRYSRHYSDMACLLSHSDASVFIGDKDTCVRVAKWKAFTFPRAWAKYELARHGTFHLLPAESRRAELAADYAAMRPMFLGEPEAFDKMMERLAVAEERMNSL